MQLGTEALTEHVRFFGRTLFDRDRGAYFFNWTGAGFELAFSGTKVDIELEAQADFYPTEGTNIPWIAVITDEAHEPSKRIGLSEGTASYTVFESAARETHRIRIVKRSENTKGRVGIRRITIAGDVLPKPQPTARHRLEFIGDSITCGFGNETDGSGTFSTSLENGLKTYSAIAADILHAEYHSVCISGIPLCGSYNEHFRIVLPDFPDFEPPARAMEDYYLYTDRFHQETVGLKAGFEEWDFERFKPDAIIINLGTNDAFRVKATGNDAHEEAHFEKRYKAFLYTLRRLNGERPVIGCTLGSMDYYLYDNICRAVEAFKAETGDARIFCYKYGGIFLWNEGIGALDHPSGKTHERMGRELAEALKKWL